MHESAPTDKLRVLVAGGGVAALEAVMALRDLARGRVQVTLVCPADDFVYVPSSVAEPFGGGVTKRVPLDRIARDFDVERVSDSVVRVEPGGRKVVLAGGGELRYDKLIVATGAPRVAAFEHATTFRGEQDVGAVRELLAELEAGTVRRLAFVVPTGVAWSLPAYELALMASRRVAERGLDAELTLITPEDRPLGVFGARASADLQRLLDSAGIRVLCSRAAAIDSPGVIALHPGGEVVECDRVVALPVTRGPEVSGLPADRDGFLPIDSFARVAGVKHVYAAGDGANFPLKQGGLACQQADVAAADIARCSGRPGEVTPFRPVLRGRLMTGDKPHFIRRDLSGRSGGREESSDRILWWPATKVAGRYLAPYLSADDQPELADHVAPGVRRIGFLSSAYDDGHEIPLRGYEFEARWAG